MLTHRQIAEAAMTQIKQYRFLTIEGEDRLFNSHKEAFAWAVNSPSERKGVYLVCLDGKLGGVNVWYGGSVSDWELRAKHPSYQFK